MGDNDLIPEIRERLVKIETMLENINNTNNLKLETIEEKIKVANNRIKDLEDNNKWLWRAVAGALISAVIAFLINYK